VRNLIAMGLVSFEDETYVRLTEEGRRQAAAIYEKHELFARFLRSIGVDELVAQQDACKIEHVVSPETVEKLKEFFSTQIEKK